MQSEIAGELLAQSTNPSEPEVAIAFLRRCLQQDPEDRPSDTRLLEDPWLVADATST